MPTSSPSGWIHSNSHVVLERVLGTLQCSTSTLPTTTSRTYSMTMDRNGNTPLHSSIFVRTRNPSEDSMTTGPSIYNDYKRQVNSSIYNDYKRQVNLEAPPSRPVLKSSLLHIKWHPVLPRVPLWVTDKVDPAHSTVVVPVVSSALVPWTS